MPLVERPVTRRLRLRRPEPTAVVGAMIVAAGLGAAILLGNTLDTGTRAAEPSPAAPRRIDLAGTTGLRPLGWSPDGAVLLAVGDAGPRIIEPGAPPEVVEGRGAAWWPGDGRTLSLVRGAGPAERLVLRAADGSERTVAESDGMSAVAWSADGQTWALVSDAGVSVGLLGGPSERVSSDRPPWVAVSPAGDRVAFARGEVSAARTGTLLVRDLVRGEQTWIGALELGRDDLLAWSPTGRFLALTARRGSEAGLFLVRPGSIEPILLMPGADPASVRWSPDGLWLAAARLAASGPVTELIAVEVRAVSVSVRSLGPGRATAWGPLRRMVSTVGPDGRLVAHPVEEADPHQLASDADPTCHPAASVVGRRIAYCTAEGALAMFQLASQ